MSSQPSAASQSLGVRTVRLHVNAGRWAVQWMLGHPSPKGGWIIQYVITNDGTKFYEAWEVPAGSRFTKTYPDPEDDTFLISSGSAVGASARFYEGLKLPADFTKGGAPNAGELFSTTKDMSSFLRRQQSTPPVTRSFWYLNNSETGL